ncbi:MAG: glutathione peroxidase [Alphaproteobacteria bacterium]|jgi:glutathione peroxidase|nr:MAG: glutathione peroxidase [Alphaproteobacteria bacterium]
MTTAHDFDFTSIEGKPLPLKQFSGHPVLIVNVASKCGLTPQYEGLVNLYHELKDQGLVVLGVPSNQFMGQEPGTNEEIQTFCSTTYGVDFPLTAKTDVKGETAHPFYQWMKTQLGDPAEPVWNFHKLLIGKDGKALKAFAPTVVPEAPELKAAINEAL